MGEYISWVLYSGIMNPRRIPMLEKHIINLLPDIVIDSMAKAKIIKEDSLKTSFIEEKGEKNFKRNNRFYQSDNIKAIKDLLNSGFKGAIDLIYIDPPFLTMVDYKSRIQFLYKGKKETIKYLAYNDIWEEGLKEYLEMLTVRLILMRDLLSDIGTIYIHLDFRTVHYVKIIMDYIFEEGIFLNEIIWAYKSGGSSKKHFSRKHDNILVYTKTKEYIFNPQKEKSYNRGLKPYGFKNVEEYKDHIGWHTLVNLKDVWNIDMVGRTSSERVNYATQKPEKLLDRIINASSNENSIIADFFAGSGTTALVAEKNKRQWILSDNSIISGLTIRKRLDENKCLGYTTYSEEKEFLKSQIIIDKWELIKGEEKFILKVKLKEYILDLKSFKMSKGHMELAQNILSEDSLSFIESISLINKPYNNTEIKLQEVYRSTISYSIGNDLEFIINSDFIKKELYLKIVDIFGCVLYKPVGLESLIRN